MGLVLFESEGHRCIAYNDLVRGDDGVQATSSWSPTASTPR